MPTISTPRGMGGNFANIVRKKNARFKAHHSPSTTKLWNNDQDGFRKTSGVLLKIPWFVTFIRPALPQNVGEICFCSFRNWACDQCTRYGIKFSKEPHNLFKTCWYFYFSIKRARLTVGQYIRQMFPRVLLIKFSITFPCYHWLSPTAAILSRDRPIR